MIDYLTLHKYRRIIAAVCFPLLGFIALAVIHLLIGGKNGSFFQGNGLKYTIPFLTGVGVLGGTIGPVIISDKPTFVWASVAGALVDTATLLALFPLSMWIAHGGFSAKPEFSLEMCLLKSFLAFGLFLWPLLLLTALGGGCTGLLLRLAVKISVCSAGPAPKNVITNA